MVLNGCYSQFGFSFFPNFPAYFPNTTVAKHTFAGIASTTEHDVAISKFCHAAKSSSLGLDLTRFEQPFNCS